MKATIDEQSTLLELLKKHFPDSSSNTLRSWIAKERVAVDGKTAVKANMPLIPGQLLTVGPRVSFIREDIKILFEDRSIVVLEKPCGLLSVATDFHSDRTVHTFLKQRARGYPVYPVHRLDRDTSGVMIFAYTDKARHHLKKQFENRQVKKTYFALVEGTLPQPKGRWESALIEDERYFVTSTTAPETGKLAVTLYEVLSLRAQYSFLRLTPLTGRKNQLRVHCSEAGVPIVGDKKYGAKSNPLKRLCLHAQKIEFVHPESEKPMAFSTSTPSWE